MSNPCFVLDSSFLCPSPRFVRPMEEDHGKDNKNLSLPHHIGVRSATQSLGLPLHAIQPRDQKRGHLPNDDAFLCRRLWRLLVPGFWRRHVAWRVFGHPAKEGVEALEDHGRGWAKLCFGTFYIKSNYPGRSSHVYNGASSLWMQREIGG